MALTLVPLAGPTLPTPTLPGLAFSQAISSFRLAAGKSLRAEIISGLLGKQRDRLEIAAQIIGQRIDRAVDHVRAVVAVAQRIAVGRRLHRALDAGHARLAGDVLDHHRLAERLAHALGERAREAVRRTAGEIRHDHRDRARRIGLRAGDMRQRRERGGACRQAEKCSARKCHDVVLSMHQSGLFSSGLMPGELDHLGPFLGFVGEELAEFRRRSRSHGPAQVVEPRLDLRIGEAGIDLAVERLDDRPAACCAARRCRTARSPRSPARTRRWSARPAAPRARARSSPPSARSLPARM